ncbi:unnamed protein product [Mycena citricolor]|uniref:Decapping nuclease n=1 Tax=Mycena citricolor TaxID=2018698 RepID=A0AAD2K0C9_9AGAR|nr:unnamed protein product [Mycena citricolor]
MPVTTKQLLSLSDAPSIPLPARLGPAHQAACMSIIDETVHVDSTAAMRYIVDAPTPAVLNRNLREGLHEFNKLPWEDRAFLRARRLDNVFEMCLKARESEEMLDVDVVTWRGILTKIMTGQMLNLNVSYYRGVLYMEEDSTVRQYDPNTECSYMGHKFETFCTTRPDYEEDEDKVDMHTLWTVAIKRTLGDLKVLLVGEVDCVKAEYTANPCPENYVELKTRRHEMKSTFPNRAKWDMQSHLLGASTIFVGFPDSLGTIRGTQDLAVRDMQPVQYKIDWGARVLQSLVDHCSKNAQTEDGRLKIWRVEVQRKQIKIGALKASEVYRLNRGGVPRSGIVPISFMATLEVRRALQAQQERLNALL